MLRASQPGVFLQSIRHLHEALGFGLGAASAVGVATLDHHITIAGFDNISSIRPLIESGTIIATVDQFGDQLAVFSIEYALEVLATGVVTEDRETPLELITVESL